MYMRFIELLIGYGWMVSLRRVFLLVCDLIYLLFEVYFLIEREVYLENVFLNYNINLYIYCSGIYCI